MSTIERKSVQATIDTITAPTDAKPYGGFIAIASDQSLDRDGEILLRSEWITPLPDRITIDTDHGMSVAATVGSARPYFQGDDLMIDAAFSSIERAQQVRSLISEGHISTVSVAALVDRSKKSGTPRRELLNVGIVAIPANRNAVIVDAKSFGVALAAVLNGGDVATVAKSLGGDGAMLQAIHDASAHLGAVCKSYGGAADWDEFTDDDEDDSGEEDGANKAFQLRALALRAKALSR